MSLKKNDGAKFEWTQQMKDRLKELAGMDIYKRGKGVSWKKLYEENEEFAGTTIDVLRVTYFKLKKQ